VFIKTVVCDGSAGTCAVNTFERVHSRDNAAAAAADDDGIALWRALEISASRRLLRRTIHSSALWVATPSASFTMERPLSAPPVGKATRVLDQALVLEMSGEAEAAEVREVALRNMTIAAVDVASMTAQPWPRLEAISLSQNPLGSGESAAQLWSWLGQCDSLRCLNLNFCELESLEVRQPVGLRARPKLAVRAHACTLCG
jgi:hypothetical protein